MAGKTHLTSFDWFRSLAILLIVASHSFGLAHIKIDGPWDVLASAITRGATAYFVFISGVMFHYLSLTRFSYPSFLIAKWQRIALPYVFLTCTLFLPIWPWDTLPVTAEAIFGTFVLGDSFQAYWYVPFILLLLCFAPLYVVFAKMPLRGQIVLVAVLMAVAMMVHRPVDNDNHLQSLVYFLPLFLAGMMFSQYRVQILAQRGLWLLALVAGGLTWGMVYMGQAANLHKPFFAYGRPDIGLVQKLLICILLAAAFEHLPRVRVIETVAKTSFVAYFLHPFAIRLLMTTPKLLPLTGMAWLDLVWISGGLVAICTLIALMMRRLLGRFSAFLIGY